MGMVRCTHGFSCFETDQIDAGPNKCFAAYRSVTFTVVTYYAINTVQESKVGTLVMAMGLLNRDHALVHGSNTSDNWRTERSHF